MSFETITFGRITNSYLNQAIIGGTMKNQKKYVDLNLEYSSQKKINTLSDDPMSITALFNAKNDLSKIATYSKNIDMNTSELNVAESSLDSANKDLTRIYTLANQAAQELNGTTEAGVIANEIEETLKHIITLANTNYSGKNIFSGANINVAAYSVSGNDYRYQGTKDSDGYFVNMQVSDNTSITLNENGNNIFGEYYVSASTLVSYGVIGHVKELLSDLRATPPNFDGIRDKLDVLKEDQANMTYYRTKIGTNLSTLEKIKDQLAEQKINSETIRSNLEDSNLVEVASKLQYQEYALQASLQSASKVVQNSLLNFLNA